MKKLFLCCLLVLIFGFGCTTKIAITPVSYSPSLLHKKNPTSVFYFVDDDLKTLVEEEGTLTVYSVEIGPAIYESIRNMMNHIFENPEEIHSPSSASTIKKPLIHFSRVNSRIIRKPGEYTGIVDAATQYKGSYQYFFKIRVRITKDNKTIAEQDFEKLTDDYLITFMEKNISYETVIKKICEQTIKKVFDEIASILKEYQFD